MKSRDEHPGSASGDGELPARTAYWLGANIALWAFFALLFVIAGLDNIHHSVVAGVVLLILAAAMIRPAMATVVANDKGVKVRNIFRTVRVPWADITGVSVGGAKGFSYKLVVHRRSGPPVGSFAVSGWASKPESKPSRFTRATVDDLNARLTRVTGREPEA